MLRRRASVPCERTYAERTGAADRCADSGRLDQRRGRISDTARKEATEGRSDIIDAAAMSASIPITAMAADIPVSQCGKASAKRAPAAAISRSSEVEYSDDVGVNAL